MLTPIQVSPATSRETRRGLRRVVALLSQWRAELLDLTIVTLGCCLIVFLGIAYDIFENSNVATPAELRLELDEALLAGVVFVVGLCVFLTRLHLAQKRESARRLVAEQEVRKLAYQDPLTGLANRRMFEDQLKQAVASPPKAGACHAVLLLDLNGFKQINDTYGHDVGDEVLVAVAHRLLALARKGDIVGRLGGDEFVILAQHLIGPEDAANIALRIIQALTEPITCGTVKSHRVGTGIGISLLPSNAQSDSEALRMADVALYRAKTEKRSAYRFFDECMDALVKEREQMESSLRTAIAAGAIVPEFRPFRDLRHNEIIGFSVVPVWLSDAGPVHPDRFLPIAEETGLIHDLGRQLLETACRAFAGWEHELQLSVCIYPGQLKDPELARSIMDIVEATGLAPSRLEMTIEENVIVKDLEAAKRAFNGLHAAGVRTAVDNFGTGYSTIYHMRELKLDKVRIDRRLAEGAASDEGAKLLRALAGLGRGLGLAVSVTGAAAGGPPILVGSGIDEEQFTDEVMSLAQMMRDGFKTAAARPADADDSSAVTNGRAVGMRARGSR